MCVVEFGDEVDLFVVVFGEGVELFGVDFVV